MEPGYSIGRSLLRLRGPCFAVILLIGFAVLLIAPVLRKIRSQASPSEVQTCRSNLILLSEGCNMYAQDYDEYYPPAAIWMDAVSPYISAMNGHSTSTLIYKCPSIEAIHPNGFGYMYNDRLSVPAKTERTKSSGLDSHTPMIFDGVSEERNAFAHDNTAFVRRHYGFGNVVYIDGHVKLEKVVHFAVH